MTSNFDRWEKDPFFPAAEEVQDSADRMESTFRAWVHDWEQNLSSHELQRELQTALSTTKWQLEEFEKAVGLGKNGQRKETVTRHKQFVVAIRGQISRIEDSLKESVLKEGKSSLPWVQLDKGEQDELALFLAGDSGSHGHAGAFGGTDDKPGTLNKESSVQKTGVLQTSRDEGRCDLNYGFGLDLADASDACEKDDRRISGGKCDRIMNGHRRAASANADFGVWKVAVADDEPLAAPPSKIVNICGLIKHIEASSNVKWSKNSFKKMKNADHHQSDNVLGSRSHPLSRAMRACYEKSSDCLDSCSIESEISYDKQLHGWLGAVHRQLQRSQYHIQNGRQFQAAFWLILAVCLIGNHLEKKWLRGDPGRNVKVPTLVSELEFTDPAITKQLLQWASLSDNLCKSILPETEQRQFFSAPEKDQRRIFRRLQKSNSGQESACFLFPRNRKTV